MNDNRGSIILGYLVVATLIGLSAAVNTQSTSEQSKAMRSVLSSQAFWLAEAGTHQAKWEYNNNDCQGMTEGGTNNLCNDCTCNNANKTIVTTFNDVGSLRSTIDYTNTVITSSGTSGSGTQLTKTIEVELDGELQEQLFTHAAFAKNRMIVGRNATINSYDSTTGRYGGQNISSGGHVGTNSSRALDFLVGRGATIEGDVSTGAGGQVVAHQSANISGNVTHDNNRSLPDVSVPTDLATTAVQANVGRGYHVGSYGQPRDVTLTAGDYHMNYVSMHNNSTITIDGDVRIYASQFTTGNRSRITIRPGGSLTIFADRNINVNQNHTFDNQTNDPSKLVLLSTTRVPSYGVNIGTSPSMNNDFVGTIYVPNGRVLMFNNTKIHGSVVGGTVDMRQGSSIHFDENLVNFNSPFDSVSSSTNANRGRIYRFRRVFFKRWRQIL